VFPVQEKARTKKFHMLNLNSSIEVTGIGIHCDALLGLLRSSKANKPIVLPLPPPMGHGTKSTRYS